MFGVQRRDAHDNQHEDGDCYGGVMTDKAERRQTQQDPGLRSRA
jgi:hypothetical protein